MADLWRHMWRWPFYSIRRTSVIFALLLLTVFTIGRLTGDGQDSPRRDAVTIAIPTPSPAPPTPSAEESPGYGDTPASPTASRQPSPPPVPSDQALAITKTAEKFVAAWARPSLAAPAWLAGIKPYTDPDYLNTLTMTNPANVPAKAVNGPGHIDAGSTDEASVVVPTDRAPVRVVLSHANAAGRWLVISITPAV